MKLIDFLIHLLATQAKTLQRLAAFFGEEELLQMLESAGDEESEDALPILIDPKWFDQPKTTDSPSAYAQLEGSVREFKLPAVLEFHLWAYPFYRSIIESSLNLKSVIRGDDGSAGEKLVNEAIAQATIWIKKLPIHPEVSIQAERAALVPWLRFRSEVLKKIGKRPFASL
jgi:hypothetical protein